MVVFNYGSVVFFNVRPSDQATLLRRIKASSEGPIASGFEYSDGYEVKVDSSLPKSCEMGGDRATVRSLDLNSVAVMATVMGQTVALDYYYVVVDNMLETFTELNRTVERTGRVARLSRQQRAGMRGEAWKPRCTF